MKTSQNQVQGAALFSSYDSDTFLGRLKNWCWRTKKSIVESFSPLEIPLYLTAIQDSEVIQYLSWRAQVDLENELAERVFCQDLIWSVIQLSGKQIENQDIQDLLKKYFYSVDQTCYEEIEKIILKFLKEADSYYRSHSDSETETLFITLPNKMVRSVIDDIKESFNHYEKELSAEVIVENDSEEKSFYQTAKDSLRSGYDFLRHHPKKVVTAIATTAALTYALTYARTRSNAADFNPFSQSQFPQWITPAWQTTNVLTNLAATYALSYASLGREFGVPSVFVSGILLFSQLVASQSISSSISQPVGAEIFFSDQMQVNNYTNGEQRIGDADGWSQHFAEVSNYSFALMWGSFNQSGTDWDIFSQLFYNNGSKIVSNNFRINTYLSGKQWGQCATRLLNNTFGITWTSPQDGSSNGIYGQRFDAVGNKVSTEFQVNDYTNNNQMRPAVGSTPNGNFIVAWQSVGQRSEWDIYAKVFNATGYVLNAEFRVTFFDIYRHGYPGVVGLDNNDYRISWLQQNTTTDQGIGNYYKDYNTTGFPLTGELPTSNLPRKTTRDGYYLKIRNNATLGKLYGQIYNLIYNQTGNELLINPQVDTTSYGQSSTEDNSLVVWRNNVDGSGINLFGTLIDWSGRILLQEFRIDQYPDPFLVGNQLIFQVNSVSAGQYVVSWQSFNGSNYGEIYLRVVDPSLMSLTSSTSTTTLTTSTSTTMGSTSTINSAPSFFSTTRSTRSLTEVTSTRSEITTDKTTHDISRSTEPGSKVIVILGIVLGIVCGIGTIGVLGMYLLRKNKNTEKVDGNNETELTGDNVTQKGRAGIYDSVSELFDEGGTAGKGKSPYGKVPIQVMERVAGDRESIYQATPSRIKPQDNPTSDTTESPYGMTPSRVTALP